MKKVVALVALVGCMVVGSSSFGQGAPGEHGEHAEKSPIESGKINGKDDRGFKVIRRSSKGD